MEYEVFNISDWDNGLKYHLNEETYKGAQLVQVIFVGTDEHDTQYYTVIWRWPEKAKTKTS